MAETTTDKHRKAEASFLKNLMNIAKSEDNLGQADIANQVRAIEQQQNQTEVTTITAMESVESRGRIMTFLMGADYASLGQISREAVETSNRLGKLNQLAENMSNDGDKTSLETQILKFKLEQAKIDEFIAEKEKQFSLFGWAFKFL
jgi:hypothetical protein